MRIAERLPLRLLLVGATTLLVAFGLVSAAAAVTLTMRSQLISEVDRNLYEAMREWAFAPEQAVARELAPLEGQGPDAGQGGGPVVIPHRIHPPAAFYVAIRTADGNQVMLVDADRSAPRLPEQIPLGVPVNVPDDSGEGEWRALAERNPRGDITVLAVPLDATVGATVTRLIEVQALVSVVVLLLVGGAAWFLVRRSLRPLQDVEAAAHELAEGNLDQRLPDLPRHTEVGSLSHSFNGMAERIEAAFADTEASAVRAERSEERMRRFVADAGHELRTPLTSIIGFAELYRTGMLSDADTAFDRIEPEARRMKSLVEDLLTLARLDAERPMAHDPVDLTQVAADAIAGARAIAPERDLSLRLDAAPVVTGDPDKLCQVALNLVINGIRHAGEDARVRIVVAEGKAAAESHDASVGKPLKPGTPIAVLSVIDDGIGMSRDSATACFERFHRVDDSRTRTDGKGGNGLGLSIVSGIVEAHGGMVHLDTAPGQGSCFRVEIPIDPGVLGSGDEESGDRADDSAPVQ